MIDTGGTIVHAAEFIRKRGAKTIRVAATHGSFQGIALQKITNSQIDEVLTTDTIAHRKEVTDNPKITVIHWRHCWLKQSAV